MSVHVIARILGLCTNAAPSPADGSAWWRERAMALEGQRQMDHAEIAGLKAENARLREHLGGDDPYEHLVGVIR
jgi:hypothetical protein